MGSSGCSGKATSAKGGCAPRPGARQPTEYVVALLLRSLLASTGSQMSELFFELPLEARLLTRHQVGLQAFGNRTRCGNIFAHWAVGMNLLPSAKGSLLQEGVLKAIARHCFSWAYPSACSSAAFNTPAKSPNAKHLRHRACYGTPYCDMCKRMIRSANPKIRSLLDRQFRPARCGGPSAQEAVGVVFEHYGHAVSDPSA